MYITSCTENFNVRYVVPGTNIGLFENSKWSCQCGIRPVWRTYPEENMYLVMRFNYSIYEEEWDFFGGFSRKNDAVHELRRRRRIIFDEMPVAKRDRKFMQAFFSQFGVVTREGVRANNTFYEKRDYRSRYGSRA